MIRFINTNARLLFAVLALFYCSLVAAHPMPNSVMLLDVNSKYASCELQLPLKELQFAVPFDVTHDPDRLIEQQQRTALSKYITDHFWTHGTNGDHWTITVEDMFVDKAEQTATGGYQELNIRLLMTPSPTESTRKFTIHYDGIMHQVVTHRTLVSVRKDWENGRFGDDAIEIGTIYRDGATDEVVPFTVNLAEGSDWKGFKSMVALGMRHISEGIDHLLFLLVLLISAPLLTDGKRWIGSGTTRYTLVRILQIVTAFTIGHSFTLIIGSLGLVAPNTKPVEVLIALSILLTAVHAIRPIFPSRELWIAGGFGLIHGLAFATTLSALDLEPGKLALSLFGFNVGIELMQLLVIFMVMPWLLLLSPYKIYGWLRLTIASFAGLAAMAWAYERYTEQATLASIYLEKILRYSTWAVFFLACFTVVYLLSRKTNATGTDASS